jgi:hypothetical protein
MSVTITMLQTRRGEDGTLWLSGTDHVASDTFAQLLITSNLATGPQRAAPSEPGPLTSVEATQVRTLVSVDGKLRIGVENAAENTATLQAALTAGGDVRVRTPGIYDLNLNAGPMTIPSFTSLYIGAGVTLRVAAGSLCAMFTNSRARDAGISIPAGQVSYGTSPDGITQCAVITSLATGVGFNYPVNSWIAAVCTGHGALGAQAFAFLGRGYRGVYRVVESTSTGLKYQIDQTYPGATNPPTALQLYNANENIKIWGPGTIDGNGALANQTYFAGDPRANVIWWRNAKNITVDGPRFSRGVTWTIGSNYVRDYAVRNCTPELRNSPAFSSVDFIHLSGNHQSVLIESSGGGAADNFVGMTIDVTDTAAEAANIYNWPYQYPGDMYNVTIRNIAPECICEDGFFGMVAIYGPASYRYQNINIDGVRGAGSSAIQLANYSQTNQNKLNIDSITIRNVRNLVGQGLRIDGPGVYAIDSIVVDRAMVVRDGDNIISMSDTATGTIRSFSILNPQFSPYDGVTYTRTGDCITLGGLTITSLKISGMESISLANNVIGIRRTGNGVISKFVIEDVSCSGTAGVQALTGATYWNTGTTPPTVVYSRCTYNGAAL